MGFDVLLSGAPTPKIGPFRTQVVNLDLLVRHGPFSRRMGVQLAQYHLTIIFRLINVGIVRRHGSSDCVSTTRLILHHV